MTTLTQTQMFENCEVEEEEEVIIPCCNCGMDIPEEEVCNFNNESYCEDCYSDLFGPCDYCGDDFDNHDLTYIDDSNYCSDCLAEKYYGCDHCGELTSREECYSDSNTHYCEICFHDYFAYCDDCGDFESQDNAVYTDNGVYCRYCGENFSRSDFIHPYEYKPNNNFLKSEKEKSGGLYMGIELEVEQRENSDLTDTVEALIEDYAHEEQKFCLKEDSTLDHGFEIVSMPCTLKYHVKNFQWDGILELLKERGCISHDAGTCGLHVHASKRWLTDTEQMRVGIFIHTQHKKMKHFARRTSENYSRFKDVKDNGYKESNKNDDRYEAVNFLNFQTIEFRLFRGTLSLNTFFATIQFVHATMNFVKTISSIKLVNVNFAWNQFCKYVKLNAVDYPNLINYLELKDLLV